MAQVAQVFVDVPRSVFRTQSPWYATFAKIFRSGVHRIAPITPDPSVGYQKGQGYDPSGTSEHSRMASIFTCRHILWNKFFINILATWVYLTIEELLVNAKKLWELTQ